MPAAVIYPSCHVTLGCQDLCIPETCLSHLLSEDLGVEREAETQEGEQWLLAVYSLGLPRLSLGGRWF